ncbi:YbjN domain-containing protein [Luteimicrobium subarcticum]|nr:YbjN domain-containing protein [Luteimicrobium subarcticum]
MTLFDRWRHDPHRDPHRDDHRADATARRPRRMRREPLDDATAAELGLDAGRGTVRQVLADLAPRPLDRARVVDWLGSEGYSYFVDSEGDLGGIWQGRLFYFLLFGENDEIVQVRGQWHRDLTIERLEEILEVCNEWNADRIWPKAYTRVRDNGMVQVYTEVTVDLEFGANDEQLADVLQCGLSTASLFFDTLDDTYPDPLRSTP